MLLGESGSGKTSFLHALSKRLSPLEGKVFYNDMPVSGLNVPNITQVVSQLDNHIATLTVKETLQFAMDCRRLSLLKAETFLGNQVEEEQEELHNGTVDAVLQLLGLSQVADTVIGNATLKGISGGEKRRVMLGEMTAAGARVWLLDEISSGLDSAATFDICETLLQACKVFNHTVLVSLLQPPPESYLLFDDLILMK